MLLLPALKNKLGKNSINSENIVKGLAEIENSDWFKYMLCKAYKCIEFGLIFKEDVHKYISESQL